MALYALSDVVERLENLVREMGSQKLVAEYYRVSQQHLNDVLAGRREPGTKLIRAMGLIRRVVYDDGN